MGAAVGSGLVETCVVGSLVDMKDSVGNAVVGEAVTGLADGLLDGDEVGSTVFAVPQSIFDCDQEPPDTVTDKSMEKVPPRFPAKPSLP